MDNLIGFSHLFDKILSDCGIVAGVAFFLACMFAWQLAKTRAAWEADRRNIEQLRDAERKNVMQVISDSNKAYDNLSIANAELRGILLQLQITSNRDNLE
jgi:hypothetical protein